tara:strand:+ start:16 stop:579 length:564 start_codon:yes stop_codon:yes gene_type:complete
MKFLIVGLGNPGIQYEHTRHNIGFKVLDRLAVLSNHTFDSARYGEVCEIMLRGRRLILVKPNTFMNLSGKSVAYWMQKKKVNQDNLLVVTDDISLPFGIMRMRKKGSSGGHNGLNNIQLVLGHNKYARLRFGVGKNFSVGNQADYVLSKFTDQEQDVLDEKIEISTDMIQSFITQGIDRTMSDFNGK